MIRCSQCIFTRCWATAGTPVEWCLQFMFLKFRHGLRFESFFAEVSDSISERRFCQVPLHRTGFYRDSVSLLADLVVA
jgi:hypothetical protein